MPTDVVRAQLYQFIANTVHEPPAAYLLDDLARNYVREFGPVPLDSVPPGDVLRLLSFWRIEGRTDDPCPAWCEHERGHRYDMQEPATGRGIRTHSRQLSRHVDLCVDEHEGDPVDERAVQLFVAVEGEWLTSAEGRRLAAEILDGSDALDQLAGTMTWTEDQL